MRKGLLLWQKQKRLNTELYLLLNYEHDLFSCLNTMTLCVNTMIFDKHL